MEEQKIVVVVGDEDTAEPGRPQQNLRIGSAAPQIVDHPYHIMSACLQVLHDHAMEILIGEECGHGASGQKGGFVERDSSVDQVGVLTVVEDSCQDGRRS